MPFISAQHLRKGAANSASGARKLVAEASVRVRMDPAVKRAIAAIPTVAWETVHYTEAILDESTGILFSSAEVAETGFTPFTSHKKAERVLWRLVVRRIPELNPGAAQG